MKRRWAIPAITIVVGFVLFAPLMGESYRFRLTESAKLYAIEFQPGEYELKVFDDVASIYRGKKLVAVARVKTEPLDEELQNSTFCCDGVLKEIRLKDRRVLFVPPDPTTRSGE
jgi:hypothetical protein